MLDAETDAKPANDAGAGAGAGASPRNSPRAGPIGLHMFTEEQSAEIATFRLAMQGLAELTWGADRTGSDQFAINPRSVGALFDQLEKRLGDIIGPEAVAFAFLDPATVRGFQPAKRPPAEPVI